MRKTMKTILLTLFVTLSFNSFALKYCGSLSALTIDNDIYSVERMSLYNKRNTPKAITVKHIDTLLLMATIITENSDFDRYRDGLDWYWKNNADKYFICVSGSDLREYRGDFFMDHVDDISVWKNGEEI